MLIGASTQIEMAPSQQGLVEELQQRRGSLFRKLRRMMPGRIDSSSRHRENIARTSSTRRIPHHDLDHADKIAIMGLQTMEVEVLRGGEGEEKDEKDENHE